MNEIQDLINRSEEVRIETIDSLNTAERVGSLLGGIVETISKHGIKKE